jgi:hypothetical protein
MKGLLLVILIAAVVVVFLFTTKDKTPDGVEEVSYPQHMINVLDRADKVALETKLNGIKAALDSYYADHNEYPEMLDMLMPDYTSSTNLLIDPWGNRFKIETDDEMNLMIISAGKDGIWGNKDDIKRRI